MKSVFATTSNCLIACLFYVIVLYFGFAKIDTLA